MTTLHAETAPVVITMEHIPVVNRALYPFQVEIAMEWTRRRAVGMTSWREIFSAAEFACECAARINAYCEAAD